MKMYFYLFTAVLLAIPTGCAENEMIQNDSVEDYHLESSWQWIYPPKDQLIVIRSKNELANYISPTNDLPDDIDFTVKSLLLVSGTTANGISKIIKDFTSEDEVYIFHVYIFSSPATEPTPWCVTCLVPHIKENDEVLFELHVR